MEAVAKLPLPVSVEVTTDVALFFMPGVVPVTTMVKAQGVPASKVAPDSAMELVPAVAVIVPPPQDAPAALATTNPAGSVSVNPTPVKATVSGLLMVKVRLAVVPNGIELTPNALLMEGGMTTAAARGLEISFDEVVQLSPLSHGVWSVSTMTEPNAFRGGELGANKMLTARLFEVLRVAHVGGTLVRLKAGSEVEPSRM